MKSILTLAVLLGALATPALADEATSTTPAPAAEAVVLAPVAGAAQPQALPPSSSAEVVPMSSPAMPDGEAGAKAKSGGCSHQAVYLTN